MLVFLQMRFARNLINTGEFPMNNHRKFDIAESHVSELREFFLEKYKE
jgi:hypothetical protein